METEMQKDTEEIRSLEETTVQDPRIKFKEQYLTLFGNVDLDCVSYFSVTYKSLNVPGRTEIYIFESRLPYTDDESSDSEISSLNPTKTEYLNFKKGQTTEFVNILKHLGVQITELDN